MLKCHCGRYFFDKIEYREHTIKVHEQKKLDLWDFTVWSYFGGELMTMGGEIPGANILSVLDINGKVTHNLLLPSFTSEAI